MSKALSTTENAMRAIRQVERTAIRRAKRVIERGAYDATKIDDDGLPVGEAGEEVVRNPERKRVAMDMRKPKREAPVYVEVMTRRLESAEKLDAASDQGQPVSLNIGVMVVQQGPQYSTLDVTPKRSSE